MAVRGPILLVGNSVRYLAQSARDAGVPVLGVDAFADLDTQLACQDLRRAEATVPRALLNAVRTLNLHDSISWSYGAGFESAPELLASLSRHKRNLSGNDAKVMKLLADPARFFSLLAKLDIAHPDTSLQRPPDPSGWLFKPAGSVGGLGVQWAGDSEDESGPGCYQVFIDGPLCSLLFAASGSDVQVIGFNRLMARNPSAGDFRFAAAIGGLEPSQTQQGWMVLAAQRLTRALRLRGVNGLDFVLRQGEPLLLELNARPPATLELYEAVLPRGGLVCHLEACDGRLPSELHQADPSPTGMRVVYASRDLHLGAIDWPGWAKDRPAEGDVVKADSPMCTVHARGGDAEMVGQLLRQREDAVRGLIHGFSKEAA